MRAATLNTIAVSFPELLIRRFLRIIALGVLQTLWCETFEEVVNILVICSLARSLKAAGEEDLIDPVLFVVDDAVFQQGTVNIEAIIPFFVLPGVDLASMEVQHNLLHIAINQHAAIDAHCSHI